jgi:Aldehyde dehydrogenase family
MTADKKRHVIDMASRPEVHLHIGGERFDAGSGGIHDHIDPSTGQVDAKIPLAGPGEVDRAVSAADTAFREWRRTPPEERRRLLLRLADLIEANGRGVPPSEICGRCLSAVHLFQLIIGSVTRRRNESYG